MRLLVRLSARWVLLRDYCSSGLCAGGGGQGGKEDALPLTGTSVPAVTSAHTAAACCIAVNQQAAPAGGIRHRRSVFPQQHQLLPLTS